MFDIKAMSLTQEQLGHRLKAARNARELTQQGVAEALAVPRTAVVEIEAGRRAVGSLELVKLAQLYGRTVAELLREEQSSLDPLSALLLGDPHGAELRRQLERQVELCREARSLEDLLGVGPCKALAVRYALDPPQSRWEAADQGRRLALAERGRLDLGSAPLDGMAETLRGEGVRVVAVPMPDDVSGVSLHGRELGALLFVHAAHGRVRRLFELSHAYCHLLADRDRPGTVCRSSLREEPWEVRANSFAAHFLMPEAGVRSFLRSLGKGAGGRGRQEVYGGDVPDGGASFVAEAAPAYQRLPAKSQEIEVHDVVAVAHRFRAGTAAMLFHLLNLGLLGKERFEALRERQLAARELRGALWPSDEEREQGERWSLAPEILLLALEAHRREAISRRKLLQLTAELGIDPGAVERVLGAEGGDEPLDVLEPS